MMRAMALALALSSAGCTINYADFPVANISEVTLDETNYKYVATNITSTNTGFRFLGIGSSPTYANVMRELREQAKLTAGPRALVNVTQDHTSTYYLGIVVVEQITATADVVEFSGPSGN